jgi:DNA replication protein DnaC
MVGGLMFKSIDVPLRRRTWMQIAAIPKNRIGWEFEDCSDTSEEDIRLIKAWIRKVESGHVIRAEGEKGCGRGLLLYGEPGHGKTTLSLVILQDLLLRVTPSVFVPAENKTLVRPCYFITYNALLDLKGSTMDDPTSEELTLFDGIMGNCIDDAYNIRVLVIDDVGKEHNSGSGWQKTMLHHVLRTRFNNGLPTIVTSNLPPEAWDATYGSATESFAREAFVPIALKSPQGDLRK